MNPQLQAATDRRHAEVVARADAALQAMSCRGETITFASVARAAHVSTDFLYRDARLRDRIERLRCSAHAPNEPSAVEERCGVHDASSAVRMLSAQMKQMRARHREQLLTLERALAAAHGENLRLRRAPETLTPDN